MVKKNNNSIPVKNYVFVIILCVLAVLFTYYIFNFTNMYQGKKYSKSYLISSNTISLEVNDLDEVKNTFKEAPSEYFIYVGYHNDEAVYKLEKKLKKIIDDYNINDNFYYIDITTMKEDKNYLEKLNNALGLKEVKIEKTPTILYFKDGVLKKDAIITREDEKMMDAGDFEHLLEIYEFKKVSE